MDEEPVESTRVGGWVDTIALSVVSADAAVTQIEAGAIDIYGSNLSTPQDLEAIEAAGLETSFQYGIYYELTFNPAGDPTFANDPEKLNPFSSARVREAMQMLVDRDYINQEIYGGNAVPKFVSFVSGFPEYGKYIDLIRPYEVKYAPNREKVVEIVTEEMEAMGATMVDGKWTYNDAPVEITFLIRTDSDGTRKPMGDIISVWLEEIGFTVVPQYGTSSELSALWVNGDVEDGLWNIYTGAWGSGVVSRDDTYDFEFFFSPRSIYGGTTLWQSYAKDLTEEQLDVMTALANKEYANAQERRDLIEQGFEITFGTSFRVWVADGRAVSPWRPDMSVSYDLSAGVDINALYPFTMRYDDMEGGLIRMGEPDLYVDPPNPVQGSNWTYDSVWQLPTSDFDTITSPHTGIPLPQRLERAEVTVETGLPVSATYDWVSLDFADEIVPPDDVWVYWNPVTETFLTKADWKVAVGVVDGIEAAVAEAAAAVDFETLDEDGVVATMQAVAGIFTAQTGQEIDFTSLIADATAIPEEDPEAEEEQDLRSLLAIRLEGIKESEDPAAALTEYALEWLQAADQTGLYTFAGYDFSTAVKKVVYYYPEELWDITWHDGSPLTIGDFVMPMIMGFAPGVEGSAIYDPSAAQSLASSMGSFKGFKIVSTDPLVIESYSDVWYEDAEYCAVAGRTAFWPEYGYGQSDWAMIAVANLAEADLALAYSADKADANEIEWMSWIGGPSLEILDGYLDQAIAENYIPFEPTLGQFVTAEEAAAKYANLKSFYGEYGHFWNGTGPFILTDVRLVEKTATLTHNDNYIDLAGKWDAFAEPKVADVAVDGAGRVTIGEEATFDVFVTFKDDAYPSDEITGVKYLLFNAASELVEVGQAELVAEGQYSVTLSAETTAALEAGANKLEVVVSAIPVSIPAIGAIEFVSE
jgi:hypothetical protein